MRNRLLAALAALAITVGILWAQPGENPTSLRFIVRIDPKQVGANPDSGRVLVGIAKKGSRIDFTNYRPPVLPIMGTDAEKFSADKTILISAESDCFPTNGLASLPPGEYSVQAIFATNRDINLPNAPGNRFSTPKVVKLDPHADSTVEILLDQAYSERVPEKTATNHYLKIPSEILSKFQGRPIEYRVGVVLPPNFEANPDKHYGLIVDIGGFGTRYTQTRSARPDPRFVQIVPDGAGPFGDPYQVNSDNNGPYGDALVQEVIPFIEKTYRCGGPKSRFTCGGSTGGWVSLALQLFYPDFFNGCWSQCPDSLTFERFELVNLYSDKNAFVNAYGFDRPGTRTPDGDIISTVRHEMTLERVLGRGGRWELGGRDWASWNSVYGPRGKDGLPVPVWNGKTGEIDKTILDHWKKYDLKLFVEKNWATLGPKLAGGKVNIWVGESDDYFLNLAVHRFKDMVSKLPAPAFDGKILIEIRKNHTSGGWSTRERLDAMAARAGL